MKREDVHGEFTQNLFALQLQLDTLLEGVGGADMGQLLDTLAECSPSERRISLRLFQRALERFQHSGVRLETMEDNQQKDFEDALYEELLDGITALQTTKRRGLLAVVDGGKLPTRKGECSKTVSLKEARERKKKAGDTVYSPAG
ncbi:hypothetical protein MRY87_03630 [bacterium]|nr:hypothetical protein [bacterium]